MRAGNVVFFALIASTLLLAQPASGAGPAPTSNAAPKAAPAQATGKPVGIFSASDVANIGSMTPAQRDKLVKLYAEKLQKMTPEARKAYFENNRKHFDALPPEKKKALTDKMKKASAEYIAAHKAEVARYTAEEKKLVGPQQKEFLEKMPGMERAVLEKYKQMRKTHNKDFAWHTIIQDAGHGGKLAPVPEDQ